MRRVEIIGNIGRDGELKVVSGNTDVINFSVAAKGPRKDDEAEWFRCALFGKRAFALAEYLKKGARVFVRGELRRREWSSNGKSGVDLDVNVEEIELLGDRSSRPRTEDSAPNGDEVPW